MKIIIGFFENYISGHLEVIDPPLVIERPLGFEPGFHSEFLMLGEKVETAGGAWSMTPARRRSMVNDPCALAEHGQ